MTPLLIVAPEADNLCLFPGGQKVVSMISDDIGELVALSGGYSPVILYARKHLTFGLLRPLQRVPWQGELSVTARGAGGVLEESCACVVPRKYLRLSLAYLRC